MPVLVYIFFGAFSALVEMLAYRLCFSLSLGYSFSSYFSYLLSAAVSFAGNLIIGFKVRMSLDLGIFCFLIVVLLNLSLLRYLSRVCAARKMKPFFSSMLNIFATSVLNFAAYSIIALIL